MLGIQPYGPKGSRLDTPFSWISLTLCSSLTANATKLHGRQEASEYSQCKKGIFFIFVSNIINRVILRKASPFCVNFLLLCLLRVYFAPYTLKKIRCFYTLVSKYFVSYMLMIVKKRPVYIKQLTPLAPSFLDQKPNSLLSIDLWIDSVTLTGARLVVMSTALPTVPPLLYFF